MKRDYLVLITDDFINMKTDHPMYDHIRREICSVTELKWEQLELRSWGNGRTAVYKKAETSDGGSQ
jgi:hypothetical protein